MSHNKDITSDLDKACNVTKSDLKKYVLFRLDLAWPEGKTLVTKRLIARTLIYLEGYSACLKENMTGPVSISEVQKFLLSEGFQYIWKRIDKQQ